MENKSILHVAIIISLMMTGCVTETAIYQGPSAGIEERIEGRVEERIEGRVEERIEERIEGRVEELLSRMTMEEKINMISGDTTRFDTRGNERLGIPALNMADGPVGVRSREGKSTAFPASICMASTWNTDLMYKLGQSLGREVKAKGKNVLLAPCVNIHRVPHGGRNFESFGEDPYLAAKIATNYIKGVQSENVIATVKHFACNNQEFERNSIDVKIDERTLHEIYFPAFKAAVQDGGVWAVMSAYNRLNGHYCSSNTWLLTDILKKQWGFKGFVMSDWGAVHSLVPTLYAGLDLEMPTARYFKPEEVSGAIRGRRMKANKIDDKVRRMLRPMFYMGYFDKKDIGAGGSDTPEHRKVALQVAQEGIVLLKNQNNVLPIGSDIKSIALIGVNAKELAYGGGGSSRVVPGRTISVLEALSSKAGDNYTLRYEPGKFSESDYNTIPLENLITKKGTDKTNGILVSYYADPDLKGEIVKQEVVETIDYRSRRRGRDRDESEPDFSSIAWEGQLKAAETGSYLIGLGNNNHCRLYVNGEDFIDNSQRRWGLNYKYANIELEKDKPVDIKVEYYQRGGRASVRLVWQKVEFDPYQKALEAAKSSDMAILFLGSTLRDDSEGRDRRDLSLPKDQEDLILAVSKINPKTIVVLNCGAGILINKWLDKVSAVAAAWFPGQEGGEAIANILLGKVNPSGKLATTFFKRWEDCAGYGNYPGEDDVVNYTEGVFMGYRHFDVKGIEPYFAFGHGLSYTSFGYDNLTLSSKKVGQGEPVIVSFTLSNTGKLGGAEVVQLYVGDAEASVARPAKELKGFQKVFLKAGEKRKVTLKIEPEDMKFFDISTHDWKAEAGRFNVRIGSSSKNIRLKDSFILQ